MRKGLETGVTDPGRVEVVDDATMVNRNPSRRKVWKLVGCLFVLVVGSARGCREHIPRG